MAKKEDKFQQPQPEDQSAENNHNTSIAEEQEMDTPEKQPTTTGEPPAFESEAELKKLQEHNEELKDKYLRLYAEFENYKKRTLKEKIDMMKTAAQDTLAALLPVLDDFDRAKKNAESADSREPFSEGVNLVYQKLYNILRQQGLEPMETNGQPFDPEWHEAVTEIPAPSEDMKGKIIDTIEKGYLLKDKIIRHAKVVVGK